MADEQAAAVDVPEEFRRLGYSGHFHQEATLDGDAVAVWRDKAPCLLPAGGWLLLSVDAERRTGVVVRQDTAAVWDLVALPVQFRDVPPQFREVVERAMGEAADA